MTDIDELRADLARVRGERDSWKEDYIQFRNNVHNKTALDAAEAERDRVIEGLRQQADACIEAPSGHCDCCWTLSDRERFPTPPETEASDDE